MRRLCLLIALVALLAVPASAKEGVRAVLESPVKLDTAPGKTMRVKWRLEDADGHPFGAGGIYLRVSRCGHRPMRVRATGQYGTYSARFRVPKGGIRKLMVGLEGWRTIGDRTERADAYFQFVPALGRRCP
jgi:hypothetical protein